MATLAANRSNGIRLADEGNFELGRMRIMPALRQVIWADQTRTIEPRIMQVLVALGRKPGGIVSRDALIESCWDGRIVGENALQRAISLLRALGAETGAFEIETITKVGYRLKAVGTEPVFAGTPVDTLLRPDRRAVLAGASALAAVAVGAIWLQQPSADRRAAERFRQASAQVLRRDGVSSVAQAIDLLERAAQADPEYADVWADLASARLESLHLFAEPEHDALLAAVRQAGERALALDPDHRQATTTLALSRPNFRNWIEVERELRSALIRFPDEASLRQRLGELLMDTGRIKAAADQIQWLYRREPLVPANNLLLARVSWYAGNTRRADALLANARRIAVSEPSVWVASFNHLVLTGRPHAALALAGRSTLGFGGQSPLDENAALLTARALSDGSPESRQQAVGAILAARRIGRIASFIAIPYLVALGATERVWNVLYVYYIGHQDSVTGERLPLPTVAWRRTDILFSPPLAPLRHDPRFLKIAAMVGLDRYWRQTRTRPEKT